MNKKSSLIYLFALALVFTSCIKKEVTPLTDEGDTFIKFLQAPVNALFFSPFNEIKRTDLFSIRKDANSSAELQTPNTIHITADPQILDDYNTDNGTDFELLPDSLYTIGNSAYAPTADGYSVTFAAGDFAQDFTIMLNGAKWDLSKKYGIAFRISDADGRTINDGKDQILVLISIKNKYDGVYEITGTMVDITNATLTHVNNYLNANGYGNMQYELRTAGTSTCEVYDNYFYGGNYVPISSGASYSSYGSYSLIIEFDPNTDVVVGVTNYYGQPAPNGRYASLDNTGVNAYDASTKTMKIKYNLVGGPGVSANQVRTTWDETWKFIGER